MPRVPVRKMPIVSRDGNTVQHVVLGAGRVRVGQRVRFSTSPDGFERVGRVGRILHVCEPERMLDGVLEPERDWFQLDVVLQPGDYFVHRLRSDALGVSIVPLPFVWRVPPVIARTDPSSVFPRGYGVVEANFLTGSLVVAWFGVHLVLRAAWRAYRWLQYGGLAKRDARLERLQRIEREARVVLWGAQLAREFDGWQVEESDMMKRLREAVYDRQDVRHSEV